MAKDNGTTIVRYEAARRALVEARTVDEVKTWLDKSAALAEYARRAKDGTLVGEAVKIREYAERRLGEMLVDQKKAGGLAPAGRKPRIGRSERPIPTLAESGISKDLSSRAQKKAAIPEAKFAAHVDEVSSLAIAVAEGDKAIVKAARSRRRQEKNATRTKRESDLAGKIIALPQKRYGVILADPEWRFDTYSEAGKDMSSAENHYPTSDLEEIKKRDVRSIAAKDCSLWLWATVPLLPQALEVMKAWGFDYRSAVFWDKTLDGTGYWFRGRVEICLLGIRGNVPAPSRPFSSLMVEKRRRHSQKPEEIFRYIETYFPNVPKIELNARRARKGWDSWGLEAPIAEAAE